MRKWLFGSRVSWVSRLRRHTGTVVGYLPAGRNPVADYLPSVGGMFLDVEGPTHSVVSVRITQMFGTGLFGPSAAPVPRYLVRENASRETLYWLLPASLVERAVVRSDGPPVLQGV